MRRHPVPIALVLALLVFGGSAVEGSPITYYFSGTVAYAFGSLDSLTGSPFYGQLLYDPAWPTNDRVKYSIPAGAFSLTTAYGNSVSTPGFLFAGVWGISTDMGMWFEPVFDESSALGAASFVLRGPGGRPDDFLPPPLPPDLAGFSWYRSLHLSSAEVPGLMEAESVADCFTSDAGGCGASPVPEPASLLLLGSGLIGLKAWRKRRQQRKAVKAANL